MNSEGPASRDGSPPRKPGRYAGMTIPERLFAAGLLEDFGAALRRQDKVTLMQMLTTVEVEDPVLVVDNIYWKGRG